MKRICKLPAALNSGSILVCVDDAVSEEKYHCPACGEIVIAKRGNIKVHHFAHRRGTDCQYGYQTSVHLMAKEIINKTHKVLLPGRGLIVADEVILEQRLGSIFPDILVTCDGKQYIIEIYVTHPLDDEKIEKIRTLDISAIEINLSDIKQLIDRNILEDELYKPKRSSIVYNADLLRIERKRNYLLEHGKKIQILPNKEIYCPATSNQPIAKSFCDGCTFSCEDIEPGFVRCGYVCSIDCNFDENTIVTLKKVMDTKEIKEYRENFNYKLAKSCFIVKFNRKVRCQRSRMRF